MNDLNTSPDLDQMAEAFKRQKDDNAPKISFEELSSIMDPNDMVVAMAAIKSSLDQHKDDAIRTEFSNSFKKCNMFIKPAKSKIPLCYILLWIGFGIDVLCLIAMIILSIFYS